MTSVIGSQPRVALLKRRTESQILLDILSWAVNSPFKKKHHAGELRAFDYDFKTPIAVDSKRYGKEILFLFEELSTLGASTSQVWNQIQRDALYFALNNTFCSSKEIARKNRLPEIIERVFIGDIGENSKVKAPIGVVL